MFIWSGCISQGTRHDVLRILRKRPKPFISVVQCSDDNINVTIFKIIIGAQSHIAVQFKFVNPTLQVGTGAKRGHGPLTSQTISTQTSVSQEGILSTYREEENNQVLGQYSSQT